MKYFDTEKVVIKCWSDSPEDGAIEQAKNLANLPFIFRHVALMPDTHQGYGMPIGGVIACKDVVIPNAVGVDIGCGMRAVKTSLKELDIVELKKIMGLVRERVPVGFDRHKKPQMTLDELFGNTLDGILLKRGVCVIPEEMESAQCQVGTLGGGNHFIEFQKGSDGYIWFMIHSGSRNLGLKVAKNYNEAAKGWNELYHSSVPREWDLAFLPIGTEDATNYVWELYACLEFAKKNRELMAKRIKESFQDVIPAVDFLTYTDVHHNYVAHENHFGQNVYVHRKGATQAYEGILGIIPGSQGTSSYIVKGKGNPESFKSCSHGAGRKMGRKEAQRSLSLEAEKTKLDLRGIVHSIRNQADLDEASGAYKDIDVVMEEQKDLVDIVVKLEPLGVIKG